MKAERYGEDFGSPSDTERGGGKQPGGSARVLPQTRRAIARSGQNPSNKAVDRTPLPLGFWQLSGLGEGLGRQGTVTVPAARPIGR